MSVVEGIPVFQDGAKGLIFSTSGHSNLATEVVVRHRKGKLLSDHIIIRGMICGTMYVVYTTIYRKDQGIISSCIVF